MIEGLTFDAEAHAYYMRGVRVPGVTSILKPLYGDLRFVREDLLEYKGELGKAVHRAIELHTLNDLVYSSLDDAVAPYFHQYLEFEAETGFRCHSAELKVYSPLGFAGTLDLLGELNGPAMVDIKTTAALSPAVKLQTAAYQHAYQHSYGKFVARYALRLTPTNYRLQPYKVSTDKADFAGFMGLLTAYRWCAANGATLGEFENV